MLQAGKNGDQPKARDYLSQTKGFLGWPGDPTVFIVTGRGRLPGRKHVPGTLYKPDRPFTVGLWGRRVLEAQVGFDDRHVFVA